MIVVPKFHRYIDQMLMISLFNFLCPKSLDNMGDADPLKDRALILAVWVWSQPYGFLIRLVGYNHVSGTTRRQPKSRGVNNSYSEPLTVEAIVNVSFGAISPCIVTKEALRDICWRPTKRRDHDSLRSSGGDDRCGGVRVTLPHYQLYYNHGD